MLLLPDNINNAEGLIIKLRDDAAANTKENFGEGNYVFTISKKYLDVSVEQRIRLFPEDQYPNGKVHLLAAYMGYDKIREAFEVVGTIDHQNEHVASCKGVHPDQHVTEEPDYDNIPGGRILKNSWFGAYPKKDKYPPFGTPYPYVPGDPDL